MWGDFSCSGFGLTLPSEGTMNANEYNTILSDYFHPLESFILVWVFLRQDDSRPLQRSLNSLKTM